jgi:hypothetical protein
MKVYDVEIPGNQIISILSKAPPTQLEIDEATMLIKGEQVGPLKSFTDEEQIAPLETSLSEQQVPLAPTGLDRELTEQEKKNLKVLRQIATQAPAVAAGLATGGMSIPAQAGIQGLLTAAGTLAEKAITPEEQKVIGDSPIKEAGITGLTAAGLTALPGALKVAGKGVGALSNKLKKNLPEDVAKKTAKKLFKFASRLPDKTTKLIYKNPELLQENPTAYSAIKSNIDSNIATLQKQATQQFDEIIESIPENKKYIKTGIPGYEISPIRYSNIGKNIKNIRMNKDKIIKSFNTAKNKAGEPLDDSVIERLIYNEPISIDEVLEINKVISRFERQGSSNEASFLIIDKLGQIKKLMQSNIKNSDMPTEVFTAFKEYAKKMKPIENLKDKKIITSAKKLDDPSYEITEDTISKILNKVKSGQIDQYKTQSNEILKLLDKVPASITKGKGFRYKNLYSKQFEKQAALQLKDDALNKSATNLSELGVIGAYTAPATAGVAMAGGGSTLGGTLIGLPAALLGLRSKKGLSKLAQIAKEGVRKPKPVPQQVEQSRIRQAMSAVGKVTSPVINRQAMSAAKKVTSPVISRQLGGYLAPETTQQIKEERRIR